MRALFWLILIVLAIAAAFKSGPGVFLVFLFFGWLLAPFLKR